MLQELAARKNVASSGTEGTALCSRSASFLTPRTLPQDSQVFDISSLNQIEKDVHDSEMLFAQSDGGQAEAFF